MMGDTIGALARQREMLGTCPSGTWAARRADKLDRVSTGGETRRQQPVAVAAALPGCKTRLPDF